MRFLTVALPCLLLVALVSTACGGNGEDKLGPDTAIVVHPSPVESERIVNGTAYDVGWLELSEVETLVLPPAARLERSAELASHRARVRLTKTLGYAGDPPASMTPRHARRFMGVATTRRDDGTLALGTYGEWDSEGAGRAWLAVEVTVPADAATEVQYDDTLGGEESAAAGALELKDEPGHWYVSNRPATGWQRLATEPDEQAAAAERR